MKLTDIPGMKAGSRLRNIGVGVVYVFVLLVVISAAAPPEDGATRAATDGGTTTPTDAPAATQTTQQQQTQQTKQQTEQQQTQQTKQQTEQQQTQQTKQQSTGSQSTATEQQTQQQTEQQQTEQQQTGSGYEVRVSCDCEWSGNLGSADGSRSVDGSGTETFALDGDTSIVSATAQKQGDSDAKLTVQILKDGDVAKESSTSASYGVASVSFSSIEGIDGTKDESKQSPYSVRISYDGDWSGSVGGEGTIRSVDGSGTETFDIKGEPFVVSANAQKTDSGSGTLTIQILKNGEVIKESSTSAEYGVASVSVTT